jgi:uncharacterized protein (TIGR02246 family)
MWNRKLGVVVLLAAMLGLSVLVARARVPVPEVRGLLQTEDKPRPGVRLTPDAVRAEEKAIREAAEGLSAAFNKGDMDKVLSYWSSEGEYISEAGKSYQGKAQLRALLKKAIANTRGQKQSVTIQKIRFLRPDVAQEEGSITLASPDGEQDKGRYVALWLKVDGKWLLGSVRDVPDALEEGKPLAYAHLRPLAWLIGDWQEKNGDATLSVRWAPGQAFLLMDWHVKRGGEALHVHQRIGWDAANQRLRAWVHDSTGGFGDAVWEREGNKWVVVNEGQYPDGKPARSVNTWKFINKDSFQWSATDREVDDTPLPDAEATYVRKNGAREGGR